MIARLEELCGTDDVAAITSDMVERFLVQVEQLPYRPKKEVKALPLARQIEVAHAKQLPTLPSRFSFRLSADILLEGWRAVHVTRSGQSLALAAS